MKIVIAIQLNEDKSYTKTDVWKNAKWLHFSNPSPEEIHFLKKEYGIPSDFIIDVLDSYEVPRQELYQNEKGENFHLLIVLYPKVKKQLENYREYQTLPLAIIISDKQIFTISSETPLFLKDIFENKSEIHPNNLRGNHIVLDILWELTHSFIVDITEIDQTREEMEKNIVSTTKNEAFYQLIAIHKNLVYFNTGISKNHVIIRSLIESDIYSDDINGKSLLHVIKILSNQAEVMVHEANQMIDQLSEVFSSVIANNLNNIMKFLTSLTIVLTIPTIIGAFWGMNVGLPIDRSPFAFIILVVISILLSIVTIYWLKKKDYL